MFVMKKITINVQFFPNLAAIRVILTRGVGEIGQRSQWEVGQDLKSKCDLYLCHIIFT